MHLFEEDKVVSTQMMFIVAALEHVSREKPDDASRGALIACVNAISQITFHEENQLAKDAVQVIKKVLDAVAHPEAAHMAVESCMSKDFIFST